MTEWIGVDLDGTLATYESWIGPEHIGEPIAPMVERVKQWIQEKKDVRIFTARIFARPDDLVGQINAAMSRLAIHKWCLATFGVPLPVTCTKDYGMIELWDDRCVQVQTNIGEPV